jgi:hypothetical protein
VLRSIEEIVECSPVVTLIEVKDKLESAYTLIISIATIHRALQNLKITLKNGYRVLDRVNAPATLEQREQYALEFARNAPTNKKKCIFIDESGLNLHLRRTQDPIFALLAM